MTAVPALDVTPEPCPAALADVPGMADLINRYALQGLMLPKSQAELLRMLGDFLVIRDRAGRVVACGGLRVYTGDLAEVVALAVDEGWQGRGLGALLVDRLVARAEGAGIGRAFAMTLTEAFFRRLGFEPLPRGWLPEKEAADCDACPRRRGCREVAMHRPLRSDAPLLGPWAAAQRVSGRGRPGRVLPVLGRLDP